MEEERCYKFWEQDFNPVTMKKNNDTVSSINPLTEGRIQEIDEKAVEVIAKCNANTRVKIVSRFW
tara:strand:- start:336 stop:530 length:195 start_codon:yes stop_codon:yes gene_type:complete